MPEGLEFTLNGNRVRGACSPNTTLLEYLRGMGLTGAKEGCAEGDCGACSFVLLDNDCDGGHFFRPTSLPVLFGLMHEYPNAKLIAGATELGLEITKKFRRFESLISVEAISALREIQATKTEWTIGAAVTLTEIETKL